MHRHVYRRPASKARVRLDADLERQILETLKSASQQATARKLSVSQATVHRVATRAKAEVRHA